MLDDWIRMQRDLIENSFNYDCQYTCKLFNPEIRIGRDDDAVIVGAVTPCGLIGTRFHFWPSGHIFDKILQCLLLCW